MGDMADYLIMSHEPFDSEYLSEEMSPPYDPPWPITYKKCRCCGEEYLTWGKVNGKWRLFSCGKIHICPVNPLKEENDESKKETCRS